MPINVTAKAYERNNNTYTRILLSYTIDPEEPVWDCIVLGSNYSSNTPIGPKRYMLPTPAPNQTRVEFNFYIPAFRDTYIFFSFFHIKTGEARFAQVKVDSAFDLLDGWFETPSHVPGDYLVIDRAYGEAYKGSNKVSVPVKRAPRQDGNSPPIVLHFAAPGMDLRQSLYIKPLNPATQFRLLLEPIFDAPGGPVTYVSHYFILLPPNVDSESIIFQNAYVDATNVITTIFCEPCLGRQTSSPQGVVAPLANIVSFDSNLISYSVSPPLVSSSVLNASFSTKITTRLPAVINNDAWLTLVLAGHDDSSGLRRYSVIGINDDPNTTYSKTFLASQLPLDFSVFGATYSFGLVAVQADVYGNLAVSQPRPLQITVAPPTAPIDPTGASFPAPTLGKVGSLIYSGNVKSTSPVYLGTSIDEIQEVSPYPEGIAIYFIINAFINHEATSAVKKYVHIFQSSDNFNDRNFHIDLYDPNEIFGGYNGGPNGPGTVTVVYMPLLSSSNMLSAYSKPAVYQIDMTATMLDFLDGEAPGAES